MSKSIQGELKRDPSIELVRLIGCLIVIGVHSWFGTSIDYANDFSRNFISCLLADGVAIFWVIGGCFMFNNYSYKKTMLRTLKGIVIPMTAFSLLVFFVLADMLDGTFTLYGIFHKGDEAAQALQTLLGWQNPVSYCGHLWYLYVYVFLMICSPALYGLSCWLDESSKREIGFLILTLAFFILNDVTGNEYWKFSHYRINGAFPAAIEMMWGHILYRHRDLFAKKKRWIACIGIFLFLNVLRAWIQMLRYQSGSTNNSILYWYSSIGIICAASVVVFGISLIRTRETTIMNRSICTLASMTFTVYLFHKIIISALDTVKFRTRLYAFIGRIVPIGGGGGASVRWCNHTDCCRVFLHSGWAAAVA